MKELPRTLIHAGIAILLVGLVFATRPKLPASTVFKDQGQAFFPDFTDPLKAVSLEVVDVDEATESARRFKVVFDGGRYVIPSKWNHPADAKDRLGRAAASMIGLKKEDVRTDNPKDHAMYGVIDPAEASQGAGSRGTRVTMLDASGKMLSDVILGKKVKDKPNTRYVRVAGQKRVYETTMSQEISAKFSDWVETDLLQVSGGQLKKLVLESYTVDERAMLVKDQEIHAIDKDSAGKWKMEALAPGEELNTKAVDEVRDALDELRIVDVRRKPDALAKFFRGEKSQPAEREVMDLFQRGFFLTQDRWYGNEGEIRAEADDGVVYKLWFGEIVSDADEGKEAGKESRYMMILTEFDEGAFPAVESPKETKEDGTAKSEDEKKKDREEFDRKKRDRQDRVDAGRKREKDLARRFSDWYYVIAAEDFKRLKKTKIDLVKKVEQKPKDDAGEKPK